MSFETNKLNVYFVNKYVFTLAVVGIPSVFDLDSISLLAIRAFSSSFFSGIDLI